MVDFLNWTDPFDVPIFRYFNLREAFLNQFRYRNIWGFPCSKKRILALNGLLDYIKETTKLGETHPEIKKEVVNDNINLFTECDALPDFPEKTREKLFLDSYDLEYEDKLAKIVDMLEKEKESSLKLFKLYEQSRLTKFEENPLDDTKAEDDKIVARKMSAEAFRLRKLRKEIYDKTKMKHEVKIDLIRYSWKIGRFVNKFKTRLTDK